MNEEDEQHELILQKRKLLMEVAHDLCETSLAVQAKSRALVEEAHQIRQRLKRDCQEQEGPQQKG